MKIKDIAKIVKKGERIAIVGHVSPDVDCFGSVFSLKESLQSIGKFIKVFADGNLTEKIKRIFKNCELNDEFKAEDYDLIIVVDTPNKQRLGKYGDEVLKHSNIVKLDHHREKDNIFSEQEYVDVNSSSCSEICFLLINALKIKITQEIATYIYAGISADTNSFLNGNTNQNSLHIASEMTKFGGDLTLVNDVLYKSSTLKEWELDKKVFENAELFNNFGIVIIRYKDIENLGDEKNGTSKYANKIVNLENIKIGCVLTERNLNTFDCSFRSKNEVAVNKLAEKFGGGGHLNASGCVITGKYGDVRKKVIDAIKTSLKEQGFNND